MELPDWSCEDTNQIFLAFTLNEVNYAFSILKINEVVVLPPIISVPKSPPHMKGVINLRGQIIPIIDLRAALNMKEMEYNDRTCVIIVNFKMQESEKLVGFIVDSVSEVFEISESDIESITEYSSESNGNFLKGIGKVKDKTIMLLNIDEILSNNVSEAVVMYNLNDLLAE